MVYLSSPGNQMQAAYLQEMPVLLSFGSKQNWWTDFVSSFGPLLLDSGAFSEFSSGKTIDLNAYADWAEQFHWRDAAAALDDIRGDWQRGLDNWRRYDWMFPTYHSSDPPEALDVILSYQPKWIGLGMVPPRDKVEWLDETLIRIPPGIHVHGFAMRAYLDRRRIDSVDSTNWYQDSWKILKNSLTCHLTPAEAVEIVVKRYQREHRKIRKRSIQWKLDI